MLSHVSINITLAHKCCKMFKLTNESRFYVEKLMLLFSALPYMG